MDKRGGKTFFLKSSNLSVLLGKKNYHINRKNRLSLPFVMRMITFDNNFKGISFLSISYRTRSIILPSTLTLFSYVDEGVVDCEVTDALSEEHVLFG